MTIKVALFQALKDKALDKLSPGIPSSGNKFEDFMVQQLYHKLQQQGTLRIFPPRYTLHEATHSGLAHQFDIVIRQDKLTTIECKFRGKTGIDNLFAFVGNKTNATESSTLAVLLVDTYKKEFNSGMFGTSISGISENINKLTNEIDKYFF